MSEENNKIDNDDNVDVKTSPRLRTNVDVNIATLSFRKKRRVKKTKSLFDTPLENRTYWGNDCGTDLLESLIRPDIRRSLKLGHMYDFDNDTRFAMLSKDSRAGLVESQFDFMITLFCDSGMNEFMMSNCNGYVVVSFDSNTQKYVFSVNN